jgi:ureidoacrylate peracid hydrolase
MKFEKALCILIVVPLVVLVVSCGTPVSTKTDSDISNQWKRPEHVFSLNSQDAAFVIIDMQNFSCDPPDGKPLPAITSVITNINRLADFCRENNIPVIWVRQSITFNGTTDDAGLYPIFHDPNKTGYIMNRGYGTEIYPEMHYDPSKDHVVFKNRYSAFLSNPPELQEQLQELHKTQLIIAGVAANVCVESTVRDAMQMDYQVILVSDGVTATDETLLNSTLMNTRLFFGDVRTVQGIIDDVHEKR